MTPAFRLLLVLAMALPGCATARRVAVTSFRVIDAPANYVRRKLEEPEPDPVRTTTTTRTVVTTSDVTQPGRRLDGPPQPQPQTSRPTTTSTTTRPPAEPRRTSPTPVPVARSTPRSTPAAPSATPPPASQRDFPVAKAVPGKPGFVYSPYDNALVDVTGFKSGDKARDPKTRQIFIVP